MLIYYQYQQANFSCQRVAASNMNPTNLHKLKVAAEEGMNNNLVRVKGREGWTPLHFVSHNEEVDLLAKFLVACPDSVEDVTVRGETALHIALKNNKFKALDLLVCFLKRNMKRGARKLEYRTLKRKDEDDNTILHISALCNEPKVVRMLTKMTRINMNTKNLENKTALDLAVNVEIKNILRSAGAKPSSQVTDAPTLEQRLSRTQIIYKVLTSLCRIRNNILEEQRNTWMIVATLVATATYQSALSPVGGVYQVNASDNNVNITSSNYTIFTPRNAGKSVLSGKDFFVFSFSNVLSFLMSTIAVIILTPAGLIGGLVAAPVGSFIICYLFSMSRISPARASSMIFDIVLSSVGWVAAIFLIFIAYFKLHQRGAQKLRRS